MLANTPQQKSTRFGFANGSDLANTSTGNVRKFFQASAGRPSTAPPSAKPTLPTIDASSRNAAQPCNCGDNKRHYAILAATALIGGLIGYFIGEKN